MSEAAQVQRKMEMEKLRDPSIEQYLTLLEVSKSIASHRNLSELFHDLAEGLHRLLNFHFLTVVLHDATRNVMRLHTLETTIPATVQAGEEFTMEESPSALVWRTQEPLIIDDIERETRFPRVMEVLREQKVRSFCSLPLTSAHRRLGALNFGAGQTSAYTLDGLGFRCWWLLKLQSLWITPCIFGRHRPFRASLYTTVTGFNCYWI